MLGFFLDRLSSLTLRKSRPGSAQQRRQAKRLLSWFGLLCFTCFSLGQLSPARASAPAAQTAQIQAAQTQAAQTQAAPIQVAQAGPASSTTIALPQPKTPVLYFPEVETPADSRTSASPQPESFKPVALVKPAAATTAAASTVAQATPAPVPAPSSPAPAANSPTADSPTRAAGTARRPAQPLSRYEMEFNRSPIVGNRLRLQGVYPETRLGFTRPRNWEVAGAKVVLRFQHSPTLLADKSQLVVRVNDTSIGSVPLAQENSKVAEAVFTIPPNLLQDYNEVSMLAQQQTAETCSNPADPMLWTEILPDSKIIMDYRAQPIRLDFSSYPFPFLDSLSLEPNQLTYLRPQTYSTDWLSATSRFQTAAARQLDYRQLNTRLVKDTSSLNRDSRLIVIGTPAEQPILSSLSLPFPVRNGQVLDAKNAPVPDGVGLLMMTTLRDKGTPVLVATGNSAAAVRQAVQFLVQNRDRQIGTGQALTVDQITEVPTDDSRSWPGYLPTANQFELKELTTTSRQPFQDVTVRGTNAPTIQIPFRALPDDRFLRGSTMTLQYSYSNQVNPRTSAIEVKLDGVTIGSKRLDSARGERETFRLNLPENLVRPDSTLDVNFILNSRELANCGLETDQQLWGTLHSDTSFRLMRDVVVNLPDLKLLKAGFPLTAPQDLSSTAVVLPANPTDTEVETLLALSERLGRVSQAESVKTEVYTGEVPAEVRNSQNVVGIGTQARFPVAEALQDQGFNLAGAFARFWGGSRVHALPDQEGVLKQTNSPWSREHSLIALTAQTEAGLKEVQALLRQDSLFSQIQGDTVLISRNQDNPSPYDASGYNIQSLQEATPRRIQRNNSFSQMVLFLQDYWFLMLVGILLLALLLYSLSQLFLNRVANSGDAS